MLPAALADVALITAPTCAAVGDMSTSWWHAEVANLRAPQPVIRGPRCTRWRLSDVVAYWADRAARGTDAEVTELVNAKARKASAAAKAKRRVVPAPAEA